MRHLLSAMTFSSLVLVSALAEADLPPPDACTTVGQACTTAGPNHDQPGTCTASQCQRATPDGPVQYECNRCVAASGTGGSGPSTGGSSASTGGSSPATGGSTPAAGGSSSDGEPDTKSSKSDDDGCSTSIGGKGNPSALLAVVLGLLAAARARRR